MTTLAARLHHLRLGLTDDDNFIPSLSDRKLLDDALREAAAELERGQVSDLQASLRQMCDEYEHVAKRAGYEAEHNYSYRQARKLLAEREG